MRLEVMKKKEEGKMKRKDKLREAKDLKARMNRQKMEIVKSSVKKRECHSSIKSPYKSSHRKWDTGVINIKIEGTPSQKDWQKKFSKRRSTL